MNLRLQYTEARSDGVYGWVLPADAPPDGEVKPVCVFVTHAYQDFVSKVWRPKVRSRLEPYLCQRGPHRLHGMAEDFETFEVVGVPGHAGILFHWGNWGSSSEGCFCVGRKIIRTEQDRDGIGGADEMVTFSQDTFKEFMQLQTGVDIFSLTVEERFPTGE
jgi:hypothetical protein